LLLVNIQACVLPSIFANRLTADRSFAALFPLRLGIVGRQVYLLISLSDLTLWFWIDLHI